MAQVGSTAAMMEPVSSVADSNLNDRRKSNVVDSAQVCSYSCACLSAIDGNVLFIGMLGMPLCSHNFKQRSLSEHKCLARNLAEMQKSH